jgi:hypothetical protein
MSRTLVIYKPTQSQKNNWRDWCRHTSATMHTKIKMWGETGRKRKIWATVHTRWCVQGSIRTKAVQHTLQQSMLCCYTRECTTTLLTGSRALRFNTKAQCWTWTKASNIHLPAPSSHLLWHFSANFYMHFLSPTPSYLFFSCFLGWGETESTWHVSHYLAHCTIPRW